MNVALRESGCWRARQRAQEGVLRLAASGGTRRVALRTGLDWMVHQIVQLGAGKVGQIAATGNPILLEHADEDDRWVVDQRWIVEEGIKSFAGHPLMFRGDVLGVLGLFSRERLTQADFDWLRAFADQTAIAIANARAFEEIENLRRRLELENRYLREEIDQLHSFGSIVGRSDALSKVLEQIELVAPTRASVLILGESGTGKELVAPRDSSAKHTRGASAGESQLRRRAAGAI